jgi:hypothetical protein
MKEIIFNFIEEFLTSCRSLVVTNPVGIGIGGASICPWSVRALVFWTLPVSFMAADGCEFGTGESGMDSPPLVSQSSSERDTILAYIRVAALVSTVKVAYNKIQGIGN